MFKFLLKKYEKQIYELADRAVKEAEIFLGSGKGKEGRGDGGNGQHSVGRRQVNRPLVGGKFLAQFFSDSLHASGAFGSSLEFSFHNFVNL